MNTDYREIESKFYVQDIGQVEAEVRVRKALPISHSTFGRGTDYYFKAPRTATVDFIRLRELGQKDFELTVKSKDGDSNLNRLEINVNGQNRATMIDLCRAVFGTEIAILDKTYMNMHLYDGSVVTIYTIGDLLGPVLEVESYSEQQVAKLSAILSAKLPLKHEPRSLYEILVKP